MTCLDQPGRYYWTVNLSCFNVTAKNLRSSLYFFIQFVTHDDRRNFTPVYYCWRQAPLRASRNPPHWGRLWAPHRPNYSLYFISTLLGGLGVVILAISSFSKAFFSFFHFMSHCHLRGENIFIWRFKFIFLCFHFPFPHVGEIFSASFEFKYIQTYILIYIF